MAAAAPITLKEALLVWTSTLSWLLLYLIGFQEASWTASQDIPTKEFERVPNACEYLYRSDRALLLGLP